MFSIYYRFLSITEILILEDPVITTQGHTYDREAILESMITRIIRASFMFNNLLWMV